MATNIISEQSKELIIEELLSLIQKTIAKFEDKSFWDTDELTKARPFHTALIKPQFWKGSKFERSFTTVQGTVFEKIALIIAEPYWERCVKNYLIEADISRSQLQKISQILDELDHTTSKSKSEGTRRYPNWINEYEEVLKMDKDEPTTSVVIVDLFFKRDDRNVFIELKSSKPNKDQTKVSKEKMLKLQAMFDGDVETYFAMPDNPYLTRKAYAHPYPKTYFDFVNSPALLIAKEFWDFIGGEGTYEELIEIYQEVGETMEQEIRSFFQH